ncbi:MAG: hypothetical protein ACFCU2_14030 [Acidimicrobiia bacterium]
MKPVSEAFLCNWRDYRFTARLLRRGVFFYVQRGGYSVPTEQARPPLSSVPYRESVARDKDQWEVLGNGPMHAHVAAASVGYMGRLRVISD